MLGALWALVLKGAPRTESVKKPRDRSTCRPTQGSALDDKELLSVSAFAAEVGSGDPRADPAGVGQTRALSAQRREEFRSTPAPELRTLQGRTLCWTFYRDVREQPPKGGASCASAIACLFGDMAVVCSLAHRLPRVAALRWPRHRRLRGDGGRGVWSHASAKAM